MLRFTIRDVLWLTVVVGLGVGWHVERGRLLKRAEMAERSRDSFIMLADNVPNPIPDPAGVPPAPDKLPADFLATIREEVVKAKSRQASRQKSH